MVLSPHFLAPSKQTKGRTTGPAFTHTALRTQRQICLQHTLHLIPGLLYLRNGLQLLRGMDELQRRIQLEGWLFAALGTVVVSTIINVVNVYGLGGNWLPHGLEVGGTYLTMFILWCVGVTIANCRYR